MYNVFYMNKEMPLFEYIGKKKVSLNVIFAEATAEIWRVKQKG